MSAEVTGRARLGRTTKELVKQLGPADVASRSVTCGTRASSSGCRRFQRSAVSASSRNALYDVALQSSALTP